MCHCTAVHTDICIIWAYVHVYVCVCSQWNSLHFCLQAKKAREQAALKNAQSLFEEIDAEREKIESKKKAAAKKRNKRKERKRKEQAEKIDTQVSCLFACAYDATLAVKLISEFPFQQLAFEGREDPDGGEELTTPLGSPPSYQEAPLSGKNDCFSFKLTITPLYYVCTSSACQQPHPSEEKRLSKEQEK